MVKTGADCDKVGEKSVEGKAPGGAGGSTGSGPGEVESGRFSDEGETWHSSHGEEGSHGPADGGVARPRDLSGPSSSSSVSACCSDVDLEAGGGGGGEIKVSLAKVEKDCRICHMGLESSSHESGVAIELGCSCKDDLAAAHKQCAETWFKIKGNK